MPHSLAYLPPLVFLLPIFFSLFLALLPALPVHAAFTLPVRSGNDTVEQNTAQTWCFYPASLSNTTTPLDAECVGPKADFRAVMRAHLDQGASISYYSASLRRLGGPEYPVLSTPGKVYLCLSGQADDKTYRTHCELATSDNAFGGNKTFCAVAISQTTVNDACYAPGNNSVPTSNRSPATGGTPPVSLSTSLLLAATSALFLGLFIS